MGDAPSVDQPTLARYAELNRDKDRLRKLAESYERMGGEKTLGELVDEMDAFARKWGHNVKGTKRLIGRKASEEIEKMIRKAA